MNSKQLRDAHQMHVGFNCSSCNRIHYGNVSESKRLADECCRCDYCVQCGVSIGISMHSGHYCPQCIELNLVKKAKHIKLIDYKGVAFFTENAPGGNEGYYFDDDLIDCCDDAGEEPPCYVYACDTVPFKLDLYEYIESKFSEHSYGVDDLDEPDDIHALDDIRDKLNAWAASQPVVYRPNTNVVIVLDDKRFEKYLQSN